MTRARLVALIATVAVVVLAAGGYLAVRLGDQRRLETTPAPAGSTTDLDSVLAGPHVVFRSTALDATYGMASVVAVADPAGPRAVTTLACERVATTASSGLCLAADRGAVTTYRTIVLGPDLAPVRDLTLVGLPSRARVSPDGSLAATTTFVTGHSYADGSFSTQTLVTALPDGSGEDLEGFRLLVDGRDITAADRNLWGVTFADDDTFYATAASGGTTYLVRGSLGARTLTALTQDAECPSLSPDGRQVVYKKRAGAVGSARWRLAAYDLATGSERLLDETRNVDDQVEWLDADRILYGLPRDGDEAAVSDVWVLGVAGDAPPEVFIPQAWSPSVVTGPAG